MAKKTPKSAPPQAPKKNAKKTKTRKSRKANPGAAIKAHTKVACSVLDPFCIHARAARRPDGLGQNTVPFQVRGLTYVSTDANGNACTLIVPGYGLYGKANCTFNNPNWVVPAAWSSLAGSTFISTNAAEVRLVSAGAVFRSTASMTNCQGLVHTFTLTSPAVGTNILQLNNNNVEDNTLSLTSGFEQTFLAKPLGSTAHAFVPVASITTTMSDFNWTSFGVEIAAGPISTIVGVIEYVVNVEFHLNQTGVTTTGLPGSVVGTRPANPVALQAQTMVQSTLPSLFSGGTDKVAKRIESAASSAISNLFDSAADFGLGLLGL